MGLARVLSLCPLLITIDDAARSLTLSICQIRSQRTCRLGVACACVCVRERGGRETIAISYALLAVYRSLHPGFFSKMTTLEMTKTYME
jgi:hypothetical protein